MKQAVEMGRTVITLLSDIREELIKIRRLLNDMRTQTDRTDIR